MYYKFTDNCLIGVDQIDDEHRGLFRLVGEVHELLKDQWTDDKYFEICDVIENLKEYASEHFRHEEEYMAKIGHPDLEMQKQQHAQFCEKVNEVDLRAAESDQQALISDLLSYLAEWLYKHIIGSDLLIGKLMTVEEWKQKDNYVFSDSYLTGIDTMDEEHRELFKILGELHHTIAHSDTDDKYEQIVSLLKYFRNNLQAHIVSEEKYMESIQYEELEVQKLAHDVLLTRLKLLNLDEFDMSKQNELEEIVASVTEWILAHILQMDKHIGQAK